MENKIGIYFLIRRDKVIYIGQTANFKKRLATWQYRLQFDSFRFIPCLYKDLDHYERRWIKRFMPKLNKAYYLNIQRPRGSKGEMPVIDRKIPVTIMIYQRDIDRHGGKDKAREIIYRAIDRLVQKAK